MKIKNSLLILIAVCAWSSNQSFGAAGPMEKLMSKTGRQGQQIWWLSVPELGGAEVAFSRINGNITYVHPDYSGTPLPKGLYYWNTTQDVRAFNPTTNQIGTIVWKFDASAGEYVNRNGQKFNPALTKWVDPSRSVALWRKAENQKSSPAFTAHRPRATQPQECAVPQQGPAPRGPQAHARPAAGDRRPAPGSPIDRDRIVEAALGVPERTFVQDLNSIPLRDRRTDVTLKQALITKNPQYACIFDGNWSQPTLKGLRDANSANPPKGRGRLTILEHNPHNPHNTDIRYLQDTHPDWFFMVASNFDGLEGGMSNPAQMLEGPGGINSAPVQGEEAQMSTICAALYKKYILPPINFLESQNLFSVTQRPGHPPLIGSVNQPIVDEIKRNRLTQIPMHYLDDISIGLDQNIIITSGYYDNTMIARSRGGGVKPQFNKMAATSGPNAQKVTHIYFAAHDLDPVRFANKFNRQPGHIDRMVAQAITRAGYEAAILAAIVYKAPGLILPMMGCGSFKNDPQWIVNIIDELAPLIAASGIEIQLVVRLKDATQEGNVAHQLNLIKRNKKI